MSEDQTTIAELFARDPFSLSKLDIDRIIEHYQQARANFKLTGKGTSEKKPVDLKELGLL